METLRFVTLMLVSPQVMYSSRASRMMDLREESLIHSCMYRYPNENEILIVRLMSVWQ